MIISTIHNKRKMCVKGSGQKNKQKNLKKQRKKKTSTSIQLRIL